MSKLVAWLPGCSDCNGNAGVELRTTGKHCTSWRCYQRMPFPLPALSFLESPPVKRLFRLFGETSESAKNDTHIKTIKILG